MDDDADDEAVEVYLLLKTRPNFSVCNPSHFSSSLQLNTWQFATK